MFSEKIHSSIYIIGLCIIAFFMPISEFVTSSAQFLILTNYILEFNFRNKVKRIIENRGVIVFATIFLFSIIWVINSENIVYALKDIRIKLPILILPFIIASSNYISKIKLNVILLFFVLGVFLSAFIGILVYYNVILDIDTHNVRHISIFVSHIRLSIMICFSVLVICYWLYDKTISKKILIVVSVFLILCFLYFIVLSEAFTGLISLLLIAFFILFYLAKKEKLRTRKILKWIVVSLIPVISITFIGIQIKNFYTPTVIQNKKMYTSKGNLYINDSINPIIENGNYVYTDVCYVEIFEDWPKYSSFDLNGETKNQQKLIYILLRYMTSKGYTKDSEGLAKLTSEDIRNIENGESNYKYVNKGGVSSRVYAIILGLDTYFKIGDPSGYSVAQRLEYQKIGFNLFLKNFWFGTGTGDVDDDYKSIYEEVETKLSPIYRLRAHSQFLTFFISYGIIGGLFCLFAWFYPAIIGWDIKNYYFIVFFLIATLSMFSDDTLETSTGVVFVSFFYSILLWTRK